jgi:hypothetical protein
MYMVNKTRYASDQLVAVVWPRQSEPDVRAGRTTWQIAASEAWAMDPGKADRVGVLLAVFEEVVVGAWGVSGAMHESAVPPGKTRKVSRSAFDTFIDPRLDYLVGTPSPLPRRRNPQATFELRDLPGADTLLAGTDPAPHGLLRLGGYVLTVHEDGNAELRMPGGAELTVRTS